MPRPQPSYDYPQVHPPHPQAQYRSETQPVNNELDSRYSWMATPIEQKAPRNQLNSSHQSAIPPLPSVPEHLQHDIQRQQQQQQQRQQEQVAAREQQLTAQRQQQMASEQPQYVTPQQPQPASLQPQQYQQYQYLHRPQQDQTPPQQYKEAQKQSEAALAPQAYAHLQDTQRHPSPQPQTQQPHQTQEATTSPDPVKQAPDHPNYRSTIAPDENPLTPVSPNMRQGTTAFQTTNMSVVPPTPSSYNFNTFTSAPVPQPNTSHTGDSWTHGLCSCSEPSICMTGLFCPCILYGRVQHRLQLRSERKDPTNMLGYNAVNGSCMAWAFLCGVNGVLSGIQKSRVRRSYEMELGSGNVFSDCLEGCCCCCCVLAQNEKEIKCRESKDRNGGGGAAGAASVGYVPPSGMTFEPPPR